MFNVIKTLLRQTERLVCVSFFLRFFTLIRVYDYCLRVCFVFFLFCFVLLLFFRVCAARGPPSTRSSILRSVVWLETTWMPSDPKEQRSYFGSVIDGCRCTVKKEGRGRFL